MEKVLTTTLLGVINNNDAPIFGLSYIEFATDVSTILQEYFGFNIKCLEPIELTVDESSYFTDAAGSVNKGRTIINDNNTGNIYVKKNTTGTPIKVYIHNKYAITQFLTINGISPDTSRRNVCIVNDDTLSWATKCHKIDVSGSGLTNINIPEAFKRLTILDTLNHQYNYFSSRYVVNDLAKSQIENGRNYEEFPTLHIIADQSYTKYFDGSADVFIPHGDIYIIFKNGGYELRDQTEDGTLLYDSLA